MTNEQYMMQAINEAKKALSLGEVPVGAVIVKDGAVVGRGHNRRETDQNALLHAETVAIADACKNLGSWRLDGCRMFVTLEPCCMCAGAIVNARIDEIVYGAYDEKYGCCGSAINLPAMDLGCAPRIKCGVLKDECESILIDFFKDVRKEG